MRDKINLGTWNEVEAVALYWGVLEAFVRTMIRTRRLEAVTARGGYLIHREAVQRFERIYDSKLDAAQALFELRGIQASQLQLELE